jgi:hypothetical protein
MSNEKDGTEVPPADAIDRDESDVTNVQGLPSIAAAEDDDEDVVTRIQTEPVAPRRAADAPPRLPGVPASVAELSVEPEPQPAAAEAEGEEEIHTMDDADIETVDDDAVLEEELVEEPAAAATIGVVDVALADAHSLAADNGALSARGRRADRIARRR